ncbi:MAG: RHS repeat-associated core domain-containing protein [Acholeplasma sp.]
MSTVETLFDGSSYIYSYDELGNLIHRIHLKDEVDILEMKAFVYDAFKRIIKASTYNGQNMLIHESTFTYDDSGNILERNEIDHIGDVVTYLYIYDDIIKNRLNKIVKLEQDIETDYKVFEYANQNRFRPSKINDKTILYEGRSIIQYDNQIYTYSEQGIRIKRSDEIQQTSYTLEGMNVVKSEYKDLNTQELVEIYYRFDENNQLFGLQYQEQEYIYQRDILGQILSIVDLNGKPMVKYAYSAYGIPSMHVNQDNMTLNELQVANALKEHNIYIYKGYIYDQATQMYYLNSRYYDPYVGRFITLDDPSYLSFSDINGMNLYAYCRNNPVMYTDGYGTSPEWWQWLLSGSMVVGGVFLLFVPGMQLAGGALIGGGLGSIAGGYIAEANGYNFDVGYSIGMGVGAILGAGIAYSVPGVGQLMSSSWSFGSQALMTAGGQIVLTQGITITGAQVLAGTGALALGGFVLFAKGFGSRMGHNQYENKQIDQLSKKYNLSRSQRRILHEYISKRNYSYKKIEEIIIELFFS